MYYVRDYLQYLVQFVYFLRIQGMRKALALMHLHTFTYELHVEVNE